MQAYSTSQMKTGYEKILRTFILRSVLLTLFWLIAHYSFIQPHGAIDKWLTTKVVQGTKIGLSVLGYDTTYDWNNNDVMTSKLIYIDQHPVVLVADACNGLELIALYIGFLLSFPGPWKWKICFIPIGTLIIFVTNVLREIVLALNYKYFQSTFDFNHKYTYVFIVYLIIFLMWRFWLNRWSDIGQNVKHVN